MKQVILFLSGKSDFCTIKKFDKLSIMNRDDANDTIFLYHQKEQEVPDTIKSVPHYTFTSDILHNMGYTPIEQQLLPGSNHFPLLKFYLSYPNYDYYWLIEDDVYFNGNWDSFFNLFTTHSFDLISAYLKIYQEEPEWPWWKTLHTGNECLDNNNKIHSFNPVYRLSVRALSYIHEALSNGWSGHHEVLIPTLLSLRGCSIADMGGDGYYVIKGFRNKLYDKNTFSHLPLKPQEKRADMLYHPIKEKYMSTAYKLKKYCIISSVGSNSLHKEWSKGKESALFDLHLIVYDQSFNNFYDDADFISYSKGYKLKLVFDYLQHHPEYLEHYEYFFIPDDDIQTDAFQIARLFELMKEYHLEIAQPSLSESYFSHPHTLRDKYCLLRYTNFVEMMLPCFSRQALKKVLHTFNANESGWGTEYHWAKLIGSNHRDMAIIDQIHMVHTRPIQSFNPKNAQEASEYIKKYNLDTHIYEWGYIPNSHDHTVNIINRDQYKQIIRMSETSASNIMKLIRSNKINRLGLDGITGCALFLAAYSRISEKKLFADMSLTLIEKVGKKASLFRNDMNFVSGLPGFCWCVEWLAQNGFIYNDTNDILIEACAFINKKIKTDLKVLPAGQLLGLVWYYSIRLSNLENSQHTIYKEECEILDNTVKMLKNKGVNDCPKISTNGISLLFKFFIPYLDMAISSSESLYPKILQTAWNSLFLTSRILFPEIENINKGKYPFTGFSVIMPIYNQGHFVKRAILSLKKQTLKNWELIIVNDGSTDCSHDVIQTELEDKRITYITYSQNKGLGYALNKGLEKARFSHIAYLPADDFYYPCHLENFKNIFEYESNTILTFSGMKYNDTDSFFRRSDTKTLGCRKGYSLQLVQTAHRKTKNKCMEREEMVTEDLFIMFWNKLVGQGLFVPTCQITANWTNHPYQRHKICNENFGGSIYKYKWYYHVKPPIRIRMSEYKIINEHELYKTIPHIYTEKVQLKILIIGSLAYNPERICSLEIHGCKLYGYWKPEPLYAYESVGPFPFGNIEDIPNDEFWIERVKDIRPDIIYTVFSATSIRFVYDSITALQHAGIQIPFVWHLKEGPQICIRYGEWAHLMELYCHSAANIFTNEMTKLWFEQFQANDKPYMILDLELPKQEYFTNNFSRKLSSQDNAIHTVVVGRMIGLTTKELKHLAQNNIHIHLYSESYHKQKNEMTQYCLEIAPRHFHVHAHCPANHWVEEFSQYDAGWLHNFISDNEDDLLRLSWDDINYPCRIGVFAAAGIPMIQRNNPFCKVASQNLLQEQNIGILYNNIEELSIYLHDTKKMALLAQNVMKQRMNFTFDSHVPELIRLFKNLIRTNEK